MMVCAKNPSTSSGYLLCLELVEGLLPTTKLLSMPILLNLCFTLLLLFVTPIHAQETCESLVASLEQSFEIASQVIMTTNIMQGEREFAYSKLKLYKDRTGQWQSEMLEQRGMKRPEDSEGADDGAEPSFSFDCDGHELIQQESSWTLTLQESNPDIPVDAWVVTYSYSGSVVVPISVSGAFEAKILFIPFRGSFNTSFSDWVIPANDSP